MSALTTDRKTKYREGIELEYKVAGSTLSYRWSDVVPGFNMPIRAMLADSGWSVLRPTETWQTAELHLGNPSGFKVDENYFVIPKLGAP